MLPTNLVLQSGPSSQHTQALPENMPEVGCDPFHSKTSGSHPFHSRKRFRFPVGRKTLNGSSDRFERDHYSI